jgi:hypothetical protein
MRISPLIKISAALAVLFSVVVNRAAFGESSVPANVSALAEATLERTEGPRTCTTFVTTAQAKKLLLANRSRLWKDPDSVREAKISDPYICPTGRGTCFCIEANARNSFGGMSGLKLHGVKFSAPDQFEPIGELGPYIKCGPLAPFPEMNGKR